MMLDDKITKEAYDEKYEDLCKKLANVMDHFDRLVFESIVEKIIIGETYDDGTVDPYKLTFVLKGMDNRNVPDAKNRYKNLHKQAG